MKYKRTFLYVESVTFGERITKYVDFDILPENIKNSDFGIIQNYIIDNYLLKNKRPAGLLNEDLYLNFK